MSATSQSLPLFENWDPLFQSVFRNLLEKSGAVSAPLAVFDADGTLWCDDLGDAFFAQLVAAKALPSLEGDADPVASYKAKVAENPIAAYGWVVQAMAGLEEASLLSHVEAFVPAFMKERLFDPMRTLMSDLHKGGWEVAIVSASNEWVIREAARQLGLPASAAIGIRTEVTEGCLSDRLVEPLPNGVGKVDAIRERFGRSPLLACGNSAHDISMLAMATEMSLAVHPDPELYAEALERDWFVVA